MNSQPIPPPTIINVIRDALALGAERFALVAEPRAEREAGIVVFTCSDDAMRALGPVLQDFARQAERIRAHDKSLVLDLKFDQSAEWIFKWLDEHQQLWCWGTFSIGPIKVNLVAFTGKELCTRLARALTNRGCPCSLE